MQKLLHGIFEKSANSQIKLKKVFFMFSNLKIKISQIWHLKKQNLKFFQNIFLKNLHCLGSFPNIVFKKIAWN